MERAQAKDAVRRWVWAVTAALVMCDVVMLGACSSAGEGAGDGASDTASAPADGQGDGADAPDAEAPDGPTYFKDIKAIVDARCGACHQAGGGAPFALTSYEGLKAMGAASGASIAAGRMPPWHADPTCRPHQNPRIMPDEEKAAFAAWVAAGMPAGDPADAPDSEPPPLQPLAPTHTARMAASYLPDASVPDDYRCFILDLEFEQTQYLTASQVVPGVGALVHHALVYAIEPAQVPLVEALDAAEPGEGYTCFGGPLSASGQAGGEGGLPTQLAAWVPGSAPLRLSEGMGTRIVRGSKVVMQVHYSTVAGGLAPDQTEVLLRLTEEAPASLVTTRPLPIRALDIKAGDPAAAFTQVFTNFRATPLTIISTTPHMHLLGKRLEAHHLTAHGERACVLRVPRWDFQWQQGYRPVEAVVVQPGESIELTCEYDNSAANQPVINGVQAEPQDVTWGEGTRDEMCLLYLQMVDPWAPEVVSDAVCRPEVSACATGCPAGDPVTACAMGCEAMNGACFLCTVQALVACTRSTCGLELLMMRDCFQACGTNEVVLDGDLDACFRATCPQPYAGLLACADPMIAAGTCDEGFLTCGLTMRAP
jgi:hypothetical protein